MCKKEQHCLKFRFVLVGDFFVKIISKLRKRENFTNLFPYPSHVSFMGLLVRLELIRYCLKAPVTSQNARIVAISDSLQFSRLLECNQSRRKSFSRLLNFKLRA